MKIIKAEPMHLHNFRDLKIGIIDRIFIKIEPERHDFNQRMFNQDFARLFLQTDRRSGNLFKILSNDDALARNLLTNVKTMRSSSSLDENIKILVEEIAKSLIWFGRAYYFVNNTEREKVKLVLLNPHGIVSFLGTHIQWIPKRTLKHWDRDDDKLPREVRILDATRIMRFEMPTPIRRMLSAQQQTLAILDKHQFDAAEFRPMATYDNPNPSNHFDFRAWRDAQERTLYRATQRTGWNGRKQHSDFLDFHRLIRFRRNQILLRNDILSQISVELSRIGKIYNSEFSVELSGTGELPSAEQLNELEARLDNEDVQFSEIIEYCFNR